MFSISLYEGSLDTTYQMTWHLANFSDALSDFDTQFVRSFVYAGIATLLCLLIAYPLSYAIAFKAGKWKTALLFARHRAVLHDLPDPHLRLADDPLQRRRRRRLPRRRSGLTATGGC